MGDIWVEQEILFVRNFVVADNPRQCQIYIDPSVLHLDYWDIGDGQLTKLCNFFLQEEELDVAEFLK